jgi:hypothetical protein
MKTLQLILLTAAVVGMFAVGYGIAQDLDVRPEVLGVIDDGLQARRQQLRDALDQRRDELKRYLALRIDEMTQVCELSETQIKKLQIAAKGVVEAIAGKWEEEETAAFLNRPAEPRRLEAEARIVEARPEAALALPAEVDKDQVLRRIVEQGAMRRLAMLRSSLEGTVEFREATSSPIWTGTIDRVLTDEQQGAYRRVQEERQAFQRKAAVDIAVVAIDEELRLTPEQRQQLVEIINQHLGDQLVAFARGSGLVAADLRRQIARGVPVSKIEAILTRSQQTSWEGLKDERRSTIRRVMRLSPNGDVIIEQRNGVVRPRQEKPN